MVGARNGQGNGLHLLSEGFEEEAGLVTQVKILRAASGWVRRVTTGRIASGGSLWLGWVGLVRARRDAQGGHAPVDPKDCSGR